MQQRNTIILLRVSIIALFLGQAWECFRWKTNISNLILDPQRFGNILEWYYDSSLHDIYTNKMTEGTLLAIDQSLGTLFLIAALSTIFISSKAHYLKWPIYLGTLGLGVICFADFYAKNFYVGQLLEHAAQLTIPVFLISVTNKWNSQRLHLFMKIALAITFIAHGFFAIGYYPQPGYFIDMMIKGLGVQEQIARNSLIFFGLLDFIFALAIFLPKVAKPALIYGIIWGFITALARISTNFSFDFISNSLSQYVHEFLIRTPHFILPLIILLNSTDKINRFPFRSPKTAE